jgi:hypothetical protein
MKSKFLLTIFILIAFILSSCGGTAPTVIPTLKGEDIQNTAIAAAFTVVAQTHEALPTDTSAPTNTPVPPTEIPTQTALPTETSAPGTLPTETATTVAVVQASPTTAPASNGSDPCNKPATISGGKLADFRIVNQTNAPITVSVYLNQTPFGDCGYRGYSLAKDDSVEITDLVFGCYNLGVFINSKKPTKVFGYGCINNYDRSTFFVNNDGVVFAGK